MEKRQSALVCSLTLLVIGLFTFAVLPADPVYAVDANTYLGGAISLAKGEGYHAGTQLDHPRVTLYPPLNSLYLSLAWRVNSRFPATITWLNLCMVLLSLGFCGCVFSLLRRLKVPLSITCLMTLTLGLSPSWLTLQSFLFSDVLLSVLAGILWLLWWRPDKPVPAGIWWLTGVLLAASFLTRTAALAWVGTAGLILFWKRDTIRAWQWSAGLLLPLVAAIWWWQWCRAGYSYGSYLGTTLREPGGLQQYLANTLSQAWRYLGGEYALEMFSPALTKMASAQTLQGLPAPVLVMLRMTGVLAGAVLIALTIIGCRAEWSFRSPYVLTVIVVYLAELVLWPFPLGYRVLLPLAPAMLYWAWHGYLRVGQRWCSDRLLRALAAGGLSLNLLVNGILAVRLLQGYSQPAKLAEIRELTEWIETHTETNERIAVDDAVPLTHLYFSAERKFIGGDPGRRPWLEPGMKLDFVIAAGKEEKLALPAEQSPEIIYRTSGGQFRVYQLTAALK